MDSFILNPGAPYDIRLHFENYTSRGPQPYRYEGGAWWQALRLGNGKLVPVEVISGGIADEPLLKVNIFSDTSKEENDDVLNQIKRIFNTDYDLKPLYEFMEKDPILGRIKNDHYGLIPSVSPSVYEAVISVIVQQQISLKVAWHMISLLVKKFGDCIDVDGREFWAFPTPSRLADAEISELRGCKLSGRKAQYIKGFSEAVASGVFNPELLRDLPHQEITERLMRFRGLGRWTSEMVIVTSIGLDGVNPAGDLGVRKAISHFYNNGELLSEGEVRSLTDKWGRWKGIITYYCIVDVLH